MFLRGVLPEHHQSEDSKDVLKLLLGLIGTMAALVLGLLIATAESSYATRRSEFTQMSANNRRRLLSRKTYSSERVGRSRTGSGMGSLAHGAPL